MKFAPNAEDPNILSPTGCSVAEWWPRHAAMLSRKMKISGVKSFYVEHKGGTEYTFEVTPILNEAEDMLDDDLDISDEELLRWIRKLCVIIPLAMFVATLIVYSLLN